MNAAPPMACIGCGRRIGKRRTHFLLDDRRVICASCIENGPHALYYPDCPEQWHDMHDHHYQMGTRAGIAWAMGEWPASSGHGVRCT
jgi:hypothetical protein